VRCDLNTLVFANEDLGRARRRLSIA
jgi:hypothetical protein